jgi:hypothetical protein
MNDHDFLGELRSKVEREIDHYVYEVHEGALGTPWGEDKVSAELKKMRESLIEPYWTDVQFPVTEVGNQPALSNTRKCVVVADDGQGWLLLWDPIGPEFVLAWLSDTLPRTFGICGNAVECFLAR